MGCEQIQVEISKIDWGLVTGVIALIFTAINLYIQRKHNRLSVKPIAIISVGDYENELAVNLQNKGTGPLIIKDLSFTTENGKTKKAIIDFFGLEFKDVTWSMFLGNIDGWALLPNETKTLIKFNGSSSDNEFIRNRDKVRKVLAQIQVELLYQDIYEKTMQKKIRKLDWFER